MQTNSVQRPFTSVAILTAVAVGAVVTYLGPVLAPFLLALLLYFMIRPAAEALIRRGIRPWLAYIALFLAVAIMILGVARIVQQNALLFNSRVGLYRENLDRLLAQFTSEDMLPRRSAASPTTSPRTPLVTMPAAPAPGAPTSATATSSAPTSQSQPTSVPAAETPPFRDQIRSGVLDLFDLSVRDVVKVAWAPALNFLETLLLVFFYLLFILISAVRLPSRVRRAFDGERAETLLTIGRGIAASISQYVKVKTITSVGMGICAAIILRLFGIHNWQLWAFLFFALNYVTYIGSLFACVPPIAIAFLQTDSPASAILPAILIGANRLIWVDFVEIRLSGESLNVDPLLVLIGIVYWGWFWGVVGMILAVPMMVCLRIILGSFPKTKKWAILMSER